MTSFLLRAASGLAVLAAAPATAQHAGHGAMTMPMPMPMPAPKPAVKKASPHKDVAAKRPAANKPVGAIVRKSPARPVAKPVAPVDHSRMDHGAMDMPMPPVPAAPAGQDQMPMPAVPAAPMAAHEGMADMAGMDHAAPGVHHGAMRGALGDYAATREASGTSWQPDLAEHSGWMMRSGAWMLMVHGNLDVIADTQSGPRGDDKLFAAGMLMGMATRAFANGNVLQLRAMVSPDPLMGKSGYPLLLASGETANGRDRLIDRQHPHDLLMEVSASYSVRLASKVSAFAYAGLPGEPAFGPPAFMHRQSISTSPEAPISHHWLDSTHITFGVVTGGVVLDRVKLEASRFNGREPDQQRYDIETGALDSTAVRASWNPTASLSLQASWAYLKDPEQLEPGVNQRRWSASASYTRPTTNGWWASTLAWGRKSIDGKALDAVALESSLKWDEWTLFGRGEWTQNNELVESSDGHGKAFGVAKASLGLVRDFPVATHVALGIGGLFSLDFVPSGLKAAYGSRNPRGAMGFMRLKIR